MSTMGSFKKKMALKTYRERAQPSWHKDKGFLEKKVDYVKRAKNYNFKKKMISQYQEKAELKNDHEFVFKMVKAKVNVG
jgi:U3 small nucleolar RNA-associated protein 11